MMMKIETVGIVGAGTMGNGIAQTISMAGMNTIMIDLHDAALDAGMEKIKGSLERLVSKGEIEAIVRAGALARIKTSTEYRHLADVDIVIEAATENGELKARILRQIETVVRPETIIAPKRSSVS
jgi:3-hydroxybutyryl-CoA dehydrogenase